MATSNTTCVSVRKPLLARRLRDRKRSHREGSYTFIPSRGKFRVQVTLADGQRRQKLPGDFNPARLAEMPSSNSQNRKRKAPTLEEVDRLLKVLNGEK